MELWIPITIFAAFCQNLRSALQRHLTGGIGAEAATFIRFGFGLPFAVLYCAVLWLVLRPDWPDVGADFLWAAPLGGGAQIAATFLLLRLFTLRNFAVATAYSKTEPILAAVFGLVLLGEHVTWTMSGAILIGVAGVVAISLGKGKPSSEREGGWQRVGKPAFWGIGAAALFGGSAACYRVACLSFEGVPFLLQAVLALVAVTALQSLAMGLWMVRFRPEQLRATARQWRAATLVGLAGVSGSMGWFTAMSLQQVAYVRALGQVELLFTFAVSVLVFRERLGPRDLLGCLMILGSVLLIILLPR